MTDDENTTVNDEIFEGKKIQVLHIQSIYFIKGAILPVSLFAG